MRFRHIYTIAGKEFQGYMTSPLGVLFISGFLICASFLFFKDFFLLGQSSLRLFFEILPWIFLFIIPGVTMRLWAEERKMGTIEFLFTAPITITEAVLGKFFASLALVSLALILSGILPLILFFIGQPDWGAILGGYLGAFALAASYLAIGLALSSLTESQIVAFILSVIFIALFIVLGQDFFLRTLPDQFIPFFRYLGIDYHYKAILRGVLDSRDMVYYFSLLFLFLYWNVASLTRRQWK